MFRWQYTSATLLHFVIICLLFFGCAPAPQPEESVTDSVMDEVVATPSTKSTERDPQALVELINEIAQTEPAGATDEQRTQSLKKQMESRLQAAEELMQIADTDSYRVIAARTQLESLRILQMVGQEDAGAKFDQLANQLSENDNGDIAILGKLGQFQNNLDSMLSGKSQAADILAQLEALIVAHPSKQEVFQVASETAALLRQLGYSGDASQVFTLIGKHFADSEDPQIRAAAQRSAQQARFEQLNESMRKVMTGEPDAAEELVGQVQSILDDESSATMAIGSLLNLAQNVEYSGQIDLAKQLYAAMGPAIDAIQEPAVQEEARRTFQSGQDRLALIGQPFEVTGALLDGEPFEWNKYDGKVVLVDFWATWCGPCIRELPNVLANYEKYHEFGFDVVGVNLDEDRARVDEFLATNDLPWTTVVSADESQKGFDDPNAKRYAVQGIPFLVLVNRDGNVATLHARGPLLDEKLAELFPSATSNSEPTDTDNEDAEETGDIEMSDGAPAEQEGESTIDALDLEESETLPEDSGDSADEGDGQPER